MAVANKEINKKTFVREVDIMISKCTSEDQCGKIQSKLKEIQDNTDIRATVNPLHISEWAMKLLDYVEGSFLEGSSVHPASLNGCLLLEQVQRILKCHRVTLGTFDTHLETLIQTIGSISIPIPPEALSATTEDLLHKL